MRTFSSIILPFVVMLALKGVPGSLLAAQANVEVKVSLDRDTISLEDQAVLQITILSNDQNVPAPHLPTLPMLDVYSQGRSSNISITKGVISASLTYRYLLLPKKSGTFPIEQIAVVHQNKRYVGNPVELTVLSKYAITPHSNRNKTTDPDGNTRDYFLEAIVDNDKPFVGQQVTLTLKFHIAVQDFGSPELTEPSTTGFWAEVLGNKPVYFQRINGRRYKIIERKYALFPTQTGELTIGRALIRTTIAARNRGLRDPFDIFGNVFGRGTDVTVRSEPITVNVRPLPIKGRPDDFTGTVGKFSITATLDKRDVEVNQPVTVVFKITGVGNIKSVAEPNIPDLQDFRIYRASSSENTTRLNDRLGGTKIYEEVFIPGRPGKMELPSISYNYFDPSVAKYRIIKTNAFRIRVRKPEGYSVSPDLPYQPSGLSIGSEARDIRYIKSDIGETQPVGEVLLFTPAYVILNCMPLAILAGLVLVRKRRERLASDVGYARSRGASRMAKKRLSRARSLANTETLAEFFAEINLVLTSYIADKLNISPHGLTTDRIRELLSERQANETLIDDVIQVIEQCDFARYSPASLEQGNIDESLSKVEQAMAGIEGVRFD